MGWPVRMAAVPDDLTCPLCGGSTAHAFSARDRNRATTDERFEYRRCDSCRTYFLADPPPDMGAYYPSDYHGAPTRAELDKAAVAEEAKLELLPPFVSGGRLVEIGPGVGGFALAAKRTGFEVTGIEMDERCCSVLEEVVGVRAIRSDAPERALGTVGPIQAVVMWHSLEHLRRPWDVLASAAGELEPGGVLAIAVPNPDSMQFRLLGARWPHVDAPRHLFLFPFDALEAQAEKLGLELASVTTSDPFGLYWNAFGWGRAIRGVVRREWLSQQLGAVLARALARWERNRMRGATYTAVFIKQLPL